MRIALVYNPSSGRRVALESLRRLFISEGHELVREIEHLADASALADPPAELIVVAGGDGTVADALRAAAGRGVPTAVLPLGTANNIALSLGVHGPLEPIVRSWHDAPARPFDLGVLDAGGPPAPSSGEGRAPSAVEGRRFVEGVGGGLVEACLTSFRRVPLRGGEPPPWQLLRALRRYAQTLRQLRPRRWSLRLDGTPLEGEFLLVEVLNTRSVGPNLELAPDASPSDGVLAVVTAREADRPALAAYIGERLGGRDTRLELVARPARCVEIDNAATLHVDDELVCLPDGAGVSVRVQAAAVSVLVPPPAIAR
jgi:diacylglycerol kinase family enzyme